MFSDKTEMNNHMFSDKTERNNCVFFDKTERNKSLQHKGCHAQKWLVIWYE